MHVCCYLAVCLLKLVAKVVIIHQNSKCCAKKALPPILILAEILFIPAGIYPILAGIFKHFTASSAQR